MHAHTDPNSCQSNRTANHLAPGTKVKLPTKQPDNVFNNQVCSAAGNLQETCRKLARALRQSPCTQGPVVWTQQQGFLAHHHTTACMSSLQPESAGPAVQLGQTPMPLLLPERDISCYLRSTPSTACMDASHRYLPSSREQLSTCISWH
jgi:hypothetical protein